MGQLQLQSYKNSSTVHKFPHASIKLVLMQVYGITTPNASTYAVVQTLVQAPILLFSPLEPLIPVGELSDPSPQPALPELSLLPIIPDLLPERILPQPCLPAQPSPAVFPV